MREKLTFLSLYEGGKLIHIYIFLVREAIFKKKRLNSANVRKGGGQGPASISWSTFDFGLLNLDFLALSQNSFFYVSRANLFNGK